MADLDPRRCSGDDLDLRAVAGLFAIRDNLFRPLPWLALAFGLIMAHASNNLFRMAACSS